MSSPQRYEKLKRALAEMRSARHHFSDESSALIMMLLLDEVRQAQTVASAPGNNALVDEMRLVTVMFIDVKDSTEMAHQMEPSEWKMVLAGAHHRIADIVMRWDGHIGQYLGDGMLCFFGALRSRSDDSQRAVACALAIQQEMQTYHQDVYQQHAIEFGVRIGLATGRTVVGLMGDAVRKELLALGVTTNLASRLQSVAPVGGVLIDAATHTRIRGNFITQALAPMQLKGFEGLTPGFRVLARRAQSTKQFTDSSVNGFHLPLIGRDGDLALISHLCDRALQHNTFQIITLIGDVGMGKSRLLQEVLHLHESNFHQYVMVAHYESRETPYQLLRDLLNTHCQLRHTMSVDTIRQLITSFVLEAHPPTQAEAITTAFMQLAGYGKETIPDALDKVVGWFAVVAKTHNVMLLIDNLQWADTHSMHLLQQVARQLENRGCVILAGARPGYKELYPQYMAKYSQHARITLDRLDDDGMQQLIEAVAGQIERVPTTLTQQTLARVEGNPLFVREFLAMLFDKEVFQQREDGSWRFNLIPYSEAMATLPNGLVSVLQARLDDLSPDVRLIAQLAAVAGNIFWADAVAQMAKVDDATPFLDALMFRGIIIQQPNSQIEGELEYQFQYDLYRQVAEGMIPGNQRREAHNIMAHWLLLRIADKAQFYPDLARHFENAGLYGTALYTYLESVQDHLQRDLFEAALHYIEAALAIARYVSRDEAVPIVTKLWMLRGQALLALERYDESSASSQSALRLLDELPEDQLMNTRIQAERSLGRAYISLGRFDDAFDAMTRAHLLLPLHAKNQLASVLRAIGQLNLYRGRLEDAEAYLRRAFNNAQQTQDPRELAATLALLGHLEQEKGNLATALIHYRDLNTFNRQRSNPVLQIASLRNLGMMYMLLHQFDQAMALFDEGVQMQGDMSHHIRLLQSYRGLTMILSGHQTSGLALVQDAYEYGSTHLYTRLLIHLNFIEGLAAVGDFTRCREHAQALCIATEGTNPLIYGRARHFWGLAQCALQQQATGYALLQEALEWEAAYGGRDLWRCHVALADYEPDAEKTPTHYQMAAQHLLARIEQLSDTPDLQAAYRDTALVQRVLERAQINRNPI